MRRYREHRGGHRGDIRVTDRAGVRSDGPGAGPGSWPELCAVTPTPLYFYRYSYKRYNTNRNAPLPFDVTGRYRPVTIARIVTAVTPLRAQVGFAVRQPWRDVIGSIEGDTMGKTAGGRNNELWTSPVCDDQRSYY